MNSIKKLLMFCVVAVLCYGGYAVWRGGIATSNKDVEPDEYDNGPIVELPAEDDAPAASSGRAARLTRKRDPAANEPASVNVAESGGDKEFPREEDDEAYRGDRTRAGDPEDEQYATRTKKRPAEEFSEDDLDSPSKNDPNLRPTSHEAGGISEEKNHPEFASFMAEIQEFLGRDELADALHRLTNFAENAELSVEEEKKIYDLMDRLAGTVIYSRKYNLERPHEMRSNETLEEVAVEFDIPWQVLAKINGIKDVRNIQAGQRLKVIRGPFQAVVDVRRKELTMKLDGMYAGRFPISLGKDKIPTGEFVVQHKVLNPTYYGKDETIGSDAPANPLGEFLVDLGNSFGIHGTPENLPEGEGLENLGGIRLGQRDIEDVFDMLTRGSKVIVR